MSVAVLILMLVHVIDVGAWTWKNWVLYILTAVTVLAVTFWVGIIRIYVSSRQLGIKWRVIGILCGWIPVVHLIVLGKLISLASGETVLENEKIIRIRQDRLTGSAPPDIQYSWYTECSSGISGI